MRTFKVDGVEISEVTVAVLRSRLETSPCTVRELADAIRGDPGDKMAEVIARRLLARDAPRYTKFKDADGRTRWRPVNPV